MRAFIAVDLDESLRIALGRIQDPLRDIAPRLRFVAPEAMHVTVKFLGEIDDRVVSDITARLDAIASETRTFDFDLSGLGAFADRRERIRVVFAGVDDIDDRLSELAGELDVALAGVGVPPGARPFHPHLTLARSRQPVRLPEVSDFIAKNAARQIGVQHVDRLVLYESTLGKSGPGYRTVSTHRLEGSSPLDSTNASTQRE